MDTPQPLTKQQLRQKVAENALEEVAEALSTQADTLDLPDLLNQSILQAGKLRDYQEQKNLGTVDFDDLARTRVNISLALLNLINTLPDTTPETTPKKRKTGLSERSLKRQIFWLLLVGKIVIFGIVFTIWQAGGLSFGGFLGVMGVIFPVFATYLSIIYQEQLQQRYVHTPQKVFRIKRSTQWTTYIFFSIYYVAIILVLYLHVSGDIPDPGSQENDGRPDYKNLFGLLALVESFIGVYIGKLIATLFRKE